jgi:hypothetical protein
LRLLQAMTVPMRLSPATAPQRFFLLAKFVMEEEHTPLPTQSRAELHMRRRQWDKTSEVPAVHGASHWWALSKAVKPHF